MRITSHSSIGSPCLLTSSKRMCSGVSPHGFDHEYVRSLEKSFPVVRRPVVHYSRYTSPKWLLGCALVAKISDAVGAALPPRSDVSSDGSGKLPSDSQVMPFHPELRPLLNLTYLLTRRLYLPPSVTSPNAWRVSLVLFANATKLSLPSSSGGSSAGAVVEAPQADRKALMCDALRRYYDDTSAAHLVRNCSLSHGVLWRETLELYHAMQDVSASNRMHSTVVRKDGSDGTNEPDQSGIASDIPSTSSISTRLFTRPNPPVFRAIRLMTLTTLLDGNKWAEALAFTSHALLSHDFPNHMTTGYMLRVLGDAHRWQETLALMEVSLTLVETRNVAILSTARGNTQRSEGKDDRSNSRDCQQWIGTFHTGLRVLARHAMADSAAAPQRGGGQADVIDWHALLVTMLRRSEACTAATGEKQGLSQQRTDSRLLYLLEQLQANYSASPAATSYHAGSYNTSYESFSGGGGDHRPASNNVHSICAAVRGAAMSNDWLAALQQLASAPLAAAMLREGGLDVRRFAPVAAARLFTLNAIPKSAAAAVVLNARRFLDVHVPYPPSTYTNDSMLAGSSASHDATSREALNEYFKQEKEALLLSFATASHQLVGSSSAKIVPNLWELAIDVLNEPLPYRQTNVPTTVSAERLHRSDADDGLCAHVMSTANTPAGVTYALWVTSMPWHLALRIFNDTRARLLVAEAKQKAENLLGQDQAAAHLGPYTSAMIHVAENLASNLLASYTQNVAHRASEISTTQQVLTTHLRDIMQKSQCSPSARLLANGAVAKILLTNSDLLPACGSTLSGTVLYYALTTQHPAERITDWAIGLQYVNHWARQTARLIPERSEESVWRRTPCFPLLAILDRLAPAPASRRITDDGNGVLSPPDAGADGVDDAVPPSHSWEMALSVWKWTRNSQPGAIQKANFDRVDASKACEQLALVALRTASTLLAAAERTRSPQPANAACRLLFDILHRHKLNAPIHCFAPATLELILPASLFALQSSVDPRGSAVGVSPISFVLQRTACLRTCLEAVVRRVRDAQYLEGDAQAVEALRKKRQEGLFQCVKMASRASRLVSEYHKNHPPATSLSPIPAGGTQSLPDFARSVWEVALVAAGIAVKVVHDERKSQSHVASPGHYIRPQFIEHLASVAAPSDVSRDLVRKALREAMSTTVIPLTEKAARLIVQHGHWSNCLELIASQQRDVVLQALLKVNSELAMQLMEATGESS